MARKIPTAAATLPDDGPASTVTVDETGADDGPVDEGYDPSEAIPDVYRETGDGPAVEAAPPTPAAFDPFRLTANRAGLAMAIAKISKAIEGKTTVEPWKYVLFSIDDDGYAWVTGRNGLYQVRARVHGVIPGEPGIPRRALFGARIVAAIRDMRDADVSLRVAPEGIEVQGERARFRFPAADPASYVTIEDVTDPGYRVASRVLMRCAALTEKSCDVESTRYALGGVLFERPGDAPSRLLLISTDGRRLSEATADADAEDGAAIPGPERSAVVPLKGMVALRARIQGEASDWPAIARFATNRVTFEIGSDVFITCMYCEGRFPAWRAIVPAADPALTVRARASEFRNTISLAKIVTSETSKCVDFTFRPDGLTIAADVADAGSAEVAMPLFQGAEGTPVAVGLDPEYILQVLRAFDSEDEAEFVLTDPRSAVQIRTTSYRHFVMPISRLK